MRNLTPKKLLDKNGRLVTRHVRSGESTTPSKPLPAPSNLDRAVTEARLRATTTKIMDAFWKKDPSAPWLYEIDEDREINIDEMTFPLRGVPEDILNEFSDRIQHVSEPEKEVISESLLTLHKRRGRVDARNAELTIQLSLEVADSIVTFVKDEDRNTDLSHLVRMAKVDHPDVYDYESDMSVEERKSFSQGYGMAYGLAGNLVNTKFNEADIRHMGDHYNYFKENSEFILENAEEILKRGAPTVELVEEFKNSSRPLMQGLL